MVQQGEVVQEMLDLHPISQVQSLMGLAAARRAMLILSCPFDMSLLSPLVLGRCKVTQNEHIADNVARHCTVPFSLCMARRHAYETLFLVAHL